MFIFKFACLFLVSYWVLISRLTRVLFILHVIFALFQSVADGASRPPSELSQNGSSGYGSTRSSGPNSSVRSLKSHPHYGSLRNFPIARPHSLQSPPFPLTRNPLYYSMRLPTAGSHINIPNGHRGPGADPDPLSSAEGPVPKPTDITHHLHGTLPTPRGRNGPKCKPTYMNVPTPKPPSSNELSKVSPIIITLLWWWVSSNYKMHFKCPDLFNDNGV